MPAVDLQNAIDWKLAASLKYLHGRHISELEKVALMLLMQMNGRFFLLIKVMRPKRSAN